MATGCFKVFCQPFTHYIHIFGFCRTAYVISKFRPRCPIIAVTRDPRTSRLVSNKYTVIQIAWDLHPFGVSGISRLPTCSSSSLPLTLPPYISPLLSLTSSFLHHILFTPSLPPSPSPPSLPLLPHLAPFAPPTPTPSHHEFCRES